MRFKRTGPTSATNNNLDSDLMMDHISNICIGLSNLLETTDAADYSSQCCVMLDEMRNIWRVPG